MTTTKTKLGIGSLAVFVSVVAHVSTADSLTNYIRLPGQQCVWDPGYRGDGAYGAALQSVYNDSDLRRLVLYCPLSLMAGYATDGDRFGASPDVLPSTMQVHVYDGSTDFVDGSVTARVFQSSAAAANTWSSCATVSSPLTTRGYVTLNPPLCSSLYPIVTLSVSLPKRDKVASAVTSYGISP